MGADSLESVYQDYGGGENGPQIIDIRNMTLQDRFQLYMDQPELGFAIFNDTVDHFCTYGAEYTEEDHEAWLDMLETQDDEEEEEDEEDDDDDESGGSQSGSPILDQSEMFAYGTGAHISARSMLSH